MPTGQTFGSLLQIKMMHFFREKIVGSYDAAERETQIRNLLSSTSIIQNKTE